jgi:predicted DNA-binding transcriptional regulator YafY
MDRYERIVNLHRTLKAARYPVPLPKLMDELGCSRATLYRDIAFLRDALGAPIDSAGEQRGIAYAKDEGERFELPGLWLSSEELSALLALQQLLERTGPGMLTGTLAPLKGRIERLLAEGGGATLREIGRIRVTGAAKRDLDQNVFRRVAGAVLERKRVRFATARARPTASRSARYRRSASPTTARTGTSTATTTTARRCACSRSTACASSSSGAARGRRGRGRAGRAPGLGLRHLSGPAKAWATIRFAPRAARWVADEHWHSKQEGRFLPDGRYELRVPYANAKELLMDVLRYGPEAEVVAPASLREEAKISLKLASNAYES